jgi:hypothetical protein
MIAFTSNHGFPFLVGDLLLSSSFGDGNLETPSFLNGTKSILEDGEDMKPLKLIRKTYVINDQLCVGIGGNYAQMYSLLNSLEAYYSDKIPTVSELYEYFKWYDKEKIDELFGIVVLAEKEGAEVYFNTLKLGALNEYKHPVFENVVVGGSGKSDYSATLNTFDQIYGGDKDLASSEAKALSQTFILMSLFLGHEVISARNLLNRWGAGFELITYKDDKFVQIDDYTYLFLNGTYSEKQGTKLGPFRAMKYKYHDDLLVIRATDFMKIEKAFGVCPINKEKGDYQLDAIPLPEYHSDHIVVFLLLKLDNDKYVTPTVSIYNKEGNGEVVIRMNEGYLEVLIDQGLLSQIEKLIQERKSV